MTEDRKHNIYDTVIFDLDGTLLNTLDDLCDGVNHALNQYHYPLRSLEEVRSFVGNGIHKLMERAVPAFVTEEELSQVFDEFRTYYTAHCNVKTRPYEGILQLLANLKSDGYKTAIVSNKNDAAVKELAELYFSGLIDVAVGQREGIRIKPAPDSVNEVMRLLHTEYSKALYVGDSEVDKATADQAHMDCILVDWGFRDREDLVTLNPGRVISHSDELFKYMVK